MGNLGNTSIVHPDGTVTTIYDRGKSESFSYWSGGGETSPQAWIEHTTTSGSHPEATTSYYLADQIGSTRMVLSAGGWPVAGGTYYPFGVEIGSSASPNHYKFSGKDRDAASGLDYFGARYYSAVMGRFMTPDWSASPEPVPYAKLDNPQSLNLYSYVENNPLTGIDADGHCDGVPANGTVSDPNGGTQFRSAENPCPSVAKAEEAQQQIKDPTLPTAVEPTPSLADKAVSTLLSPTTVSVALLIGTDGLGDIVEAGAALAKGADETYSVYKTIEEGETTYVGITNNLERRAAEHGKDLEQIAGGLSKREARGTEQALIEHHGLGKNGGTLTNRINSIARTNPIYNEAVTFGRQLLQSLSYFPEY